jgi:hypothetical protein
MKNNETFSELELAFTWDGGHVAHVGAANHGLVPGFMFWQ